MVLASCCFPCDIYLCNLSRSEHIMPPCSLLYFASKMRKWIFLLNNTAISAVNDCLSFVKNKQKKSKITNKKAKAKTEPPWPRSAQFRKLTFSSWIFSSILFEAISCALKRAMVLVSSGSKMFPLSSRTTRSNPSILETKEWSAGSPYQEQTPFWRIFMEGPPWWSRG